MGREQPTDTAADGATIQAAQTLWAGAVTVDASPTVTIKGGGEGAASSSTRAHPGTRRLAKRGERGVDESGIDFELDRLLGRGGMGVVYAARQASLDRRIAVKMIDTASARERTAVERFLAEAVVTGELDHPNIVPVYDVGGTADGDVFYAMKEVTGTAWDKTIGELPLDRNLAILIGVCDAVAFAHDRGIVHRDLKPENVMLGGYGEVMVMDWGLALRVNEEGHVCADAAAGLAGTPSFMPPEMARCSLGRIGPASDIYLLGSILYQIVTGRPPHGGATVFETISNAMANRILPTEKTGELLDIALKAMATQPADRYASVKDFQAALAAYREHAESLTIADACARRLHALDEAQEQDAYREANEIAAGFQQALELWPENAGAAAGLCRARLRYAQLALERGDLSLARSQLNALVTERRAPACGPEVAERAQSLEAELSAAQARARARERLVRVSVAAAVLLAVAALAVTGGAWVVTRRQRDEALAARAREREQRAAVQAALRAAEDAGYYQVIALAERKLEQHRPKAAEDILHTTPPRLRRWEWGHLLARCRGALLSVAGDFAAPAHAAVAADGGRFLTVGADNAVTVWDARTGKPLHALQPDCAGILAAAFTGSGGRIAAVTADGVLRTWDPAASAETDLVRLPDFPRNVSAAALGRAGAPVAALAGDGTLRLWSAGGQPAGRIALSLDGVTVETMALAPNAAGVAVGDARGVLRVFSIRSGAMLRRMAPAGPPGAASALAFAADGRSLFAGCENRVVREWDIERGRERRAFAAQAAGVTALAAAPDGRLLITGGMDGIHAWDARHRHAFLALDPGLGPVRELALSEDASCAAAGSDTGQAAWRLDDWRAADADAAAVLAAARGRGRSAWASPAGRKLRAAPPDGIPFTCAALSPDGERLAAGNRQTACLFDAATGGQVHALAAQGPTAAVAFSPDGDRLLTAGLDGVRIWNVRTGRELLLLDEHEGWVNAACFTPDGCTVLTAGNDGLVRVWIAVDPAAAAVDFTTWKRDLYEVWRGH